eukprot:Pgem_evm1s3473
MQFSQIITTFAVACIAQQVHTVLSCTSEENKEELNNYNRACNPGPVSQKFCESDLPFFERCADRFTCPFVLLQVQSIKAKCNMFSIKFENPEDSEDQFFP